MAFIDDVLADRRDQAEAANADKRYIDFCEGKASFAFGYMPTQPTNPDYMDGWVTALRECVRYEGETPIYPEGVYRAPATSNVNAAIFSTAN